MAKLFRRKARTAGLPPGTPVYTGERIENVRLSLIRYGEEELTEEEIAELEDCFPLSQHPMVTWLNVDGLHDVSVIETLGTHLGIGSLVVEDIVNTGQRPKVDDLETHILVILKMLTRDDTSGEIQLEQVSLILGPDFVVTFQDRVGDVFDVIERIRLGKGRIRRMGADYLAYALIDSIVDEYFVILENVGDRIEELDEEVLANPGEDSAGKIHHLKKDLVLLRRAVWPLREVVSLLQRAESPLISDGLKAYMADVYEHTVQVLDTTESFREMVSSLMDTYLSTISNKMNEIMKVLTIMASIFIPLTFIAGIYGMNFEHMPELNMRFAYPVVWGVMALIGGGMVTYFKKKGWF